MDIPANPGGAPFTGSVFSGGGEMGALMRAFDWSRTPVGTVSLWPQGLRTAVRIILNSRYAMFVWWGRELVNLYNDPYRAFLGIKHPSALGKSAREVWAEIWGQIGPRADAVLLRGESTFDEALLLLMERHGYPEETYFTFSYSPLPDDSGKVGGLFCAVTEETQKVIGERRLRLFREIAAAMAECRTPISVCRAAAQCLANTRRDLPFSLIYLFETDGKTLKRAAETGIAAGHLAAPESVSVEGNASSVWPLRQVIETGQPILIEDLAGRFSELPTGEWSCPPSSAVLLPIAQQGQQRPAGVLVAGLNPYLKFDDDFRGFVSLLSNQVAAAIANAVAYETERKRAEKLAELDRAKTLFFSNVSHEFRTPLTLMLGPLEEVLPEAQERLSPQSHEQLANAKRNALRLLKLVNTLLDFSRIEAGRVRAVYESTDISKLTAEIASVFSSAMQRAGLRYTVQCQPIGDPVYVDREMWEKIVLNLLSNAFKFTFEGEVKLTLEPVDGHVELTVRDTGVGIPEQERERIFERFHRIENTRARTYEGTGIGLALVQELIRLHGGSVTVESTPGRGSTFVVTIPRGKAHLEAERIATVRSLAATGAQPEAYVDEAQRWLPRDSGAPGDATPVTNLPSKLATSDWSPAVGEALIIVADDNADMRDYLAHLLRSQYRVHTVCDGLEAAEAIKNLRPDLVLADMMMPGLDGFGLLRAVRSDPTVSGTPVILLSARAGEEARVEGLQAGADDYLVKPFTARELIARVTTHVNMARLRRQTERERRLYDTILSNTPDLAYVFDLNHRFIYANKALLTMWGRTWEDAIGKNCLELGYPPWHAEMHDREIEHVIATKNPIRGEVPFTGTDGRRIYDYIFVPVLSPSGEVEAIAGTTRDITERTQAQDAIRHSEERLRAFLTASADVIYTMSADWSEMRQMEGKEFVVDTAEPITGWLDKYIHRDDQPRVTAAIIEAIRTRSVFELEHRVLRVDGSLGWTFSRAVPLLNADGEIVEWFGAAADITEQKTAEQALRRSEKLAATGRLAATMAHEINNPLEAVTNLVYLAKSLASETDVREYLAAAERELARVSHLTKQTLGFYRQTAGISNMRLAAIVNSLIAVFSSRIRNKEVEVETQIRSDPEIFAVPGEVRQVIANLLTNGIDAVPQGGRIRIRVSAATQRASNTAGVRLTIGDNGCGIASHLRPQLFEPFVSSNKEVGTGLGLWICKTIVEKHGGTISLKTSTKRDGSWTVFSVFLPVNTQWAADETLKVAV